MPLIAAGCCSHSSLSKALWEGLPGPISASSRQDAAPTVSRPVTPCGRAFQARSRRPSPVKRPSRPDLSLIAAGCRSHSFARLPLVGGPSRPDPCFIAAGCRSHSSLSKALWEGLPGPIPASSRQDAAPTVSPGALWEGLPGPIAWPLKALLHPRFSISLLPTSIPAGPDMTVGSVPGLF